MMEFASFRTASPVLGTSDVFTICAEGAKIASTLGSASNQSIQCLKTSQAGSLYVICKMQRSSSRQFSQMPPAFSVASKTNFGLLAAHFLPLLLALCFQ